MKEPATPHLTVFSLNHHELAAAVGQQQCQQQCNRLPATERAAAAGRDAGGQSALSRPQQPAEHCTTLCAADAARRARAATPRPCAPATATGAETPGLLQPPGRQNQPQRQAGRIVCCSVVLEASHRLGTRVAAGALRVEQSPCSLDYFYWRNVLAFLRLRSRRALPLN